MWPTYKLILWDIDGTLLTTQRVSSEAMQAAMVRTFGVLAPDQRLSFAGKTDWQIIHEAFPQLAEDRVVEQFAAFRAAYLVELRRQHDVLVERTTVLPGVTTLLAQLAPHAIQAPLTGNIAAAARIKLAIANLLPFFGLEVGAYGDDHYDRPCLVPIALERAQRWYDPQLSMADVVVVGDTANDIRSGKIHGARTVAVATGSSDVAALTQCEPDVVLADLCDTAAARAAILGSRSS